MANLNVLGKKINKGYSRNHDQYSAFIPEKHAYTPAKDSRILYLSDNQQTKNE